MQHRPYRPYRFNTIFRQEEEIERLDLISLFLSPVFVVQSGALGRCLVLPRWADSLTGRTYTAH